MFNWISHFLGRPNHWEQNPFHHSPIFITSVFPPSTQNHLFTQTPAPAAPRRRRRYFLRAAAADFEASARRRRRRRFFVGAPPVSFQIYNILM